MSSYQGSSTASPPLLEEGFATTGGQGITGQGQSQTGLGNQAVPPQHQFGNSGVAPNSSGGNVAGMGQGQGGVWNQPPMTGNNLPPQIPFQPQPQTHPIGWGWGGMIASERSDDGQGMRIASMGNTSDSGYSDVNSNRFSGASGNAVNLTNTDGRWMPAPIQSLSSPSPSQNQHSAIDSQSRPQSMIPPQSTPSPPISPTQYGSTQTHENQGQRPPELMSSTPAPREWASSPRMSRASGSGEQPDSYPEFRR